MSSKATLTVLAMVCSALAASAVAIAAAPVDIHNGGDLHESVWGADTKALSHGVTYTASTFAIAMRVRPPDARWEGVQLQSRTFRFVQFNHVRARNVASSDGTGLVTLEARAGRTGSVATTIQKLHATPKIEAGPVTPARVAGFAGKSFDAKVVGFDSGHYDPNAAKGISLAPFTTNRHCGYCTATMHGETQDFKFEAKGELFRVVVIDVRGKTVVIYLETTGSPPKYPATQVFPTFLPYAQKMLATLRFPTK